MALQLLQHPSPLHLFSTPPPPPPPNPNPSPSNPHLLSYLPPPAILRNRSRGLSLTLTSSIFPITSPLRSISNNNSSTAPTTAAAVEEGEVVESSEQQPRRRLIAQNIPWTCTADDIRALFESHGTVEDVELSMHNSSRNRGLAFVTMSSEEAALAALNNLNSYDLDGRVIKVEYARSLKKNPTPATKVPITTYNVFVGNLSWLVRTKDLKELLDGKCNFLSAEVIFQTNPRRPAGYGFVSFASKEEAEAAIKAFNGKRLMGRSIRLSLGKLRHQGGEEAEDGTKEQDVNLEQAN